VWIQLINLGPNIALFALAKLWMEKFAVAGAPFYNPTLVWYTNPICLSWFLAFIQALSHAFESMCLFSSTFCEQRFWC
jgi:hypothetical protein